MNREVKFRGLSENENGTKEWVYGYLGRCDGDFVIEDEDGFGCFVDKRTIGEYTGCKDANGNEIYEGDIVKVIDLAPLDASYGKQYIGKIIYDKDRFKIDYKDTCPCDTRIYTDFPYWIKIEVIGNVYENKNLLEED